MSSVYWWHLDADPLFPNPNAPASLLGPQGHTHTHTHIELASNNRMCLEAGLQSPCGRPADWISARIRFAITHVLSVQLILHHDLLPAATLATPLTL